MRMLVLGLVAVLVACSDGSGLTGARGELAARRSAWNARGIVDYDVDLRYSSAWFPPTTVRIEVRGGLAISARNVATDVALSLDVSPHAFTVDSLFETAAYWAAQPGFDVALLFHPTLSYPTQVFVDNPGWADEEQYFEIVRLVAR